MATKNDETVVQLGKLISGLFLGVLLLGATIGYWWNIIKMFQMANDPVTGMFFLRLISIVIFPVAWFLGFF